MRTGRARRLAIVLLVPLGACSTPPAQAPQPESVPAPAAVQREPMDEDRIAPISESFDDGLEIAWWVIGDSEDALVEILAPYAEDARPLPPETVTRWRGAGFRILAIDDTGVRRLLEALPPIGRVERDWIGRKRFWTECFRPPPEAKLPPRRVIGLPRPIQPERLRFLARAWPSPSRAGPVLRVDLALQHQRPRPDANRLTLDEPTLPPAESEGELFADVAAEMTLAPSQIVLITGESPGVQWTDGAAEPEPSGAIPAESFDPASAPRSGAESGFGPPVERPLSLGEAMLRAETSAIYPAPTRTIILLIPRVPPRFSLLPQNP